MKIDLAEIARGRRITAVCAKEIELIPRKSDRPKVSAAKKAMRKVSAKLKSAVSEPSGAP